jgi:3'-5' exoribonuclease
MEKFTKKQLIDALTEGDRVDDIFVVKIKKGVSQYVKGYSFNLLLTDSSGKTVDYKFWGGRNEGAVRTMYNSIKADSVVHVHGVVGFYRDMPQITTNEPDVIEALEKGQYDESDFIKKPKKDINQMYDDLMKIIMSIKNGGLQKLLLSIFEGNTVKEKFKTHPGAIEIHHNWVGGLLQHTLEVAKYCELSLELYPTMDRDLLLAGALLHDIGKLDEMEVTSRIKGSRKGQMSGHLVLGCILVAKKMDEFGIDDYTKDKLLHIIVSHHGEADLGSPKEPIFPEAVAVYRADGLSSKLAEITEYIEDNKNETEDDFKYNRRGSKNIFLR